VREEEKRREMKKKAVINEGIITNKNKTG